MEQLPGRVPSTLVVVTAALLACAAPGASTSPGRPSEAAPSQTPVATVRPAPSPSPTSTPFPTWSFFSQVPVPDDPATMLLLYQSWGDVGPETPLLVVLSDGRVVARFWHEGGSGFLATRRLTAAAMEQVRAELVVVGLFDRDRERQMIEPWPAGGAGDELQVRLSDKTVTVRRNLAPADYYEPSQAWDRFDALVDKLRAPDRWLAEELWADTRWTPYHARAFCLRIDSRQGGQPTLDSMELDVRGPILPLGSFGAPGIGTDQRTRFGSVSSADIYRFAAAVADLANAHAIPDLRDERIPLDAGAAFVLFPTLREAGVDWLVYVEALMPQQTCADE